MSNENQKCPVLEEPFMGLATWLLPVLADHHVVSAFFYTDVFGLSAAAPES